MHICDNRKCINPKHLKLGTRSDNMKDCVSKGRHVSPMRKLTDEHIEYILKSEKTSNELAKELPVTARTIRRYRNTVKTEIQLNYKNIKKQIQLI